jgi:SAM-dependent methyltransferase
MSGSADSQSYCRVLRDPSEIAIAARAANERGLSLSPDPRKAWDNMIALDLITKHAAREEPVADLGCRSGILLTWLYELGFCCLYGCDVRRPFPPLKAALRGGLWRTASQGLRMFISTRRRLVQRPVEATGFPSEAFAAAACISVIEHGVDTGRFLKEAARLLRPRGVLFVSTDYWPDKIDLGQAKLFEESRGFDRIFSRSEIESLLSEAAKHGLELIQDPSLEVREPTIVDDRAAYTSLALGFVRKPESSAK